MDKSKDYSSRRIPIGDSQHPQGDSQPLLIPDPGDAALFWSLRALQATGAHTFMK